VSLKVLKRINAVAMYCVLFYNIKPPNPNWNLAALACHFSA